MTGPHLSGLHALDELNPVIKVYGGGICNSLAHQLCMGVLLGDPGGNVA